MEVGLFFGSFNPVHNGHLILAHTILEKANLNEVWFIISPQNPFKEKKDLLDENLRKELVDLSISGVQGLKSSDIEFQLPKPSYTIDTLKVLKEKYPETRFHIILGTDNLGGLLDWKSADMLINENQFIVYPRLGYQKEDFDEHPNFSFYDLPILEMSSTYIRKAIKHHQPFQFMLHKSVFDVIKRDGYYQ